MLFSDSYFEPIPDILNFLNLSWVVLTLESWNEESDVASVVFRKFL